MWFYAMDGRKVGPVSDDELDSLAASGVIDASTLVWKEGMADWLPLATARPGVPIPKAGQEACSQCGTFHSPDDLAALSGLKVCGACKPAVVQRLKEGLPFTNIDNVWRDNDLLVAEVVTDLPKRCFHCNSSNIQETVSTKMERRFTINCSFSVKVHFCQNCRPKRQLKSWIPVVVYGIGAIFFAAAGFISAFAAISSLAAVLSATLVLLQPERPARLRKSKGKTLWISGAGQPFLDSLPKWPN